MNLNSELEEVLAALHELDKPSKAGASDTLMFDVNFQAADLEAIGDAAAFMPKNPRQSQRPAARQGSSNELTPLDPEEALRLIEQFQSSRHTTPTETSSAATAPEAARRLGMLLEAEGIVTADELRTLCDNPATRHVGEAIRQAGTISRTRLWAALAERYRLPHVALDRVRPTAEALAALPRAVAESLQALPLALTNTVGVVAVAEPLAAARTLRELRTRLGGRKVKLVQASAAQLATAIAQHYSADGRRPAASAAPTAAWQPGKPATRRPDDDEDSDETEGDETLAYLSADQLREYERRESERLDDIGSANGPAAGRPPNQPPPTDANETRDEDFEAF